MDMASASRFRTGTPRPPARAKAQGALRALTFDEISAPAFVTAWQRLAHSASEPNPFYEPWFLLPSLKQWGAADHAAVKAWYLDDRLAGLLPIRRSTDYYGHRVPHAAGWLHANAFCGAPLILAGQEETFWRTLLAHCDRYPRAALWLHLPKLPADGPVDAALGRVLAGSGRVHTIAANEHRALLTGALSADAYLAQAMSAKKRKELRRRHNRLAEEGNLTFERRADAEGVGAWADEFLTLEAAGWKGVEGSALASAPDTRAFFAEALAGAAAADRLERLALRLDGRAIALLANLITAPGAYSFKTAFAEDYAPFLAGHAAATGKSRAAGPARHRLDR